MSLYIFHKVFSLCILLMISFSAYCSNKVLFPYGTKDENYGVEVYAGKSSASQRIVSDVSNSVGTTTENSPFIVYMPYETSGGNQSIHSTFTDESNFPLYDGTSFQALLGLQMLVSNSDGEDRTLYVAVKDSNDEYVIFKWDGTNYALTIADEVSDATTSLTINLAAACVYANCDVTNDRLEMNYLIFLADPSTNFEEGNIINHDTYGTNALHISLKLSGDVDMYETELINIDTGDARLFLKYDGTSIGDAFRLAVFKSSSSTLLEKGANPVQGSAATTGGFKFYDYYSYSSEGEVKIDKLSNSAQYNFAVALVNKYLFATYISNSLLGSPEEIETLLKKQTCYVLSSGFQREHFVVRYFRYIRDRYLLKLNIGRDFVHWYYQTAPQYTGYIMSSRKLSWTIRTLGHGTYFCLKNIEIILFIIFGILFLGMIRAVRYRP